jgi:hypothetical protein
MMDRREFTAAVGFGLITVPLMIRAQRPAKVLRIGYLDTSSAGIASVRLRPDGQRRSMSAFQLLWRSCWRSGWT